MAYVQSWAEYDMKFPGVIPPDSIKHLINRRDGDEFR